MRRNNKVNSEVEKKIARKKYNERQIEKWIKWSIDNRGFVKYKDLVELHDKYGIKCY